MQVGLPHALDILDLADPGALFDHPPEGVDGAAIRCALEQALEQFGTPSARVHVAQKLRILAGASRILVADPVHRAAAIHLTRAAAPDLADTAPLARARVIALFRSGNRAAAISEASRVIALPTITSAGRQALRNLLRMRGLENRIPAQIEYAADFWPDIEAAISNPFAAIQVQGPYPTVDRTGPAIAGLHGLESDDATFLDRMRWGAEVDRRMIFTRRVATAIARKPEQQRTLAEQRMLQINRDMDARISLPDPSALLDCIAQGRSVMMVNAHAGLSTAHNHGLPLGDIPCSIVSHAVGKAGRPQDFNLATDSPNVAVEFARLAKMMKREPRIVRIFPDGGIGDTMTISVCGRKVEIGRGAASLAFLGGKAATFFAGSRWTGSGFEFYVTPGPLAADYTEKEAFEQDFGDFYARCLERIVMGSPEDMAPNGGFWHFF